MSDKRLDLVATTLKNLGTGASERITAISQIPADINSITKTAIMAHARQEVLRGGMSDAMYNITQKFLQEELAKGVDSRLSNFKPAILAGNALQRKNTSTVEGSDPAATTSTARKAAIAGLDPITKKITDEIDKLTKLADTKNMLMQQSSAIFAQINALTERLNGLTGNLGAQQLQLYQQQLDSLQTVYDTTTAAIDTITALYNAKYETLQKLNLLYIEKKKTILDIIDTYQKLLRLPEIPRSIKFPKLPKLPNINLSKADFKQQFSNLVTAVVNASKMAAQTSLKNAEKQYQPKLATEKPTDAFTTAVSSAKKALGQAEARINALNAAKQAAIDTVTGALTTQINGLIAGVALTQQNIASNIGRVTAQAQQNIINIQTARQKAQALAAGLTQGSDHWRQFADTMTEDTATLLAQAAAGMKSAQDTIRGNLAATDIVANASGARTPTYTTDEQEKLDALQANITTFLNAGRYNNFKIGVGKAKTLGDALDQSLKLQEFKAAFPDAFINTFYDKRNIISNVNGVYLVVTAVYQTRPLVIPAASVVNP